MGQSHVLPTSAGFASRATDLQSLRDAVVDAAAVGTGLWITYLSVLFYLALSAATVTHRDLLLERPVRLPLLNSDLPPLGFFILGPCLLLIFHTYVLLHLTLLSGKIGLFLSELQAQVAGERVRELLRAQLPSNVFVQLLAGTHAAQTSATAFMFRMIAYISLVAGPLVVLVFFQLQFLPYHHEFTTWWQRLAIVGDIAILWVLWPSISSGETTWITWRDLRRAKIVTMSLVSLAIVLLVVAILTFPGEMLDAALPSLRIVPISLVDKNEYYGYPKPTRWSSLHDLLVGGEVDQITRRPKSLWSNRLILLDFDPIDHVKYDTDAKVAAASETYSFRGRHLEGAILTSARLAKFDFKGAYLRGANLNYADLQGAKLDGADLREASLESADLRNASLSEAKFMGGKLVLADLAGQDLYGGHLDGATLDGAYLVGANLSNAGLVGASLNGANLLGADLVGASLDGAWLHEADLRVADLTGASIIGASLDNALLHGATIEIDNIYGASLDHVFIWRATPHRSGHFSFLIHLHGRLVDGRLVSPVFEATSRGVFCPTTNNCEWTKTSFDDLNKAYLDWLGKDKFGPLQRRLAMLNPDAPQPQDSKNLWVKLEQSSPTREAYETGLETVLRRTGCDENGGPYVIHGLLRHLRERFAPGGGAHLIALAKSFLDEVNCSGARGLLALDRVELREMLLNPETGPKATNPPARNPM